MGSFGREGNNCGKVDSVPPCEKTTDIVFRGCSRVFCGETSKTVRKNTNKKNVPQWRYHSKDVMHVEWSPDGTRWVVAYELSTVTLNLSQDLTVYFLGVSFQAGILCARQYRGGVAVERVQRSSSAASRA
jgi:hypothetical protein